MEQIYKNKLNLLGYNQLVCDIFTNWENVKDEILPSERKQGTGNGTVHVFLGIADSELRKEFPAYYENVSNGEDAAVGAVKVKHYFLATNVLSMLGYICRYYFKKNTDFNNIAKSILQQLEKEADESGLLSTESFFKLSTGASKLRPYFKQFDENGVFHKIIRPLLLPNSSYKISLFKNEKGEYAALWLIGFNYLSNFEADSNDIYTKKEDSKSKNSRQQIFYGAPGTGKSNTIKEKTEKAEKEGRVFRTTFHPDSDYSTFVGCYKPGMMSKDRIYSAEELAVKLKEIKNSGVTYPCHKFAAQYWRSLKDLSADAIKQILNACGFTESMNTEISKGVAIGQEYLNNEEDGKIIYTFTPQAFTNAYVKAWNTTEDVYLIIEEINRGNCAQIFGDLFQLLDRGDDEMSEYPINADNDLGKFIAKKLGKSTRTDFPNGVKDGSKLVLPNNLYVWATMNTSDQSLFPIDSAFKRRWDWQYIPISDGKKGWQIEANGKCYDWWQFLQKINEEIGILTKSEDKKLGYFFCKAKNGVIDAETLVGKVVFYIWNDVFKDFAEEAGDLFKDEEGILSFSRFYTVDDNGKTIVQEDKVELFLHNLGIEPIKTGKTDGQGEKTDTL